MNHKLAATSINGNGGKENKMISSALYKAQGYVQEKKNFCIAESP
jgi:hypothetical protein